ncbi:N-acetylglucosamine-6-phosphate deacetylase [Mucilaginibacter paludis]|uniref:N-acetylglucosamine-6-phosphate deacetylase n=1 Tax=Mucilaginibacter paludis DSM 18603 TaxID=714943 RepID=H1Y4U7_9SPHI|nr:N-acetylglucosamine-6-phosphate deacetylase [Mucilaginibacter paludis]EHQ28275.1 N-acetylglucosamine-6-phosphate deacetylase [Mucilaginibacter paludis DSM 18603]
MITALHNLQLISDGLMSQRKAVLIENEKIKAVVDQKEIPEEAQQIDLNGANVAPGLIDLQIYGNGSPLFFGGDPSAAALAQMEKALLRQGCTGFLATIATNTNQVVEQGIQAALTYSNRVGNLMGLHLEGPYLNPKRKGAHPAALIKKATLNEVKHWVEMANGEIKMITIAPELQDEAILTYLNEQAIVLSSGHSDATYQQAKAFINHPVKAITHLYNAMPPMHHRQPGIIPAIFEDKPYTSIVADGIHVNFTMIALAKRQLGDKLFLITDAVTESRTGVYQHQLHGDHFTMPDGTLSGSNLSLLQAVKNCVEHAEIPLAEAINMASLYPARLIGKADEQGKIAANYLANMIVFNADFEVQATILKGHYFTKTI